MQGFLSRDGAPPAGLLQAARAEVRRYGVEIIEDRVVDATAGFAFGQNFPTLEWLAAGMTIGEIVKEYPSLTEEAVRGTLEELAHSDLLAPSENPSRREHG